MTNIVRFTVYGDAQPQGSVKAFTPRGWSRPILTSDNPALKSWRQLVADAANHALGQLAPGDRALLLEGVRVSIAFYLPRPKSLPKRCTAHTKKPDVDKLVRSVCDSLSSVVFRDDAQVCELVAVKHYAAPGVSPHVTICVEPTAGVEPVWIAGTAPLFALEACKTGGIA